MEKKYLEQLKEGEHEITIDLETIPTLTVEFELSEDRMNVPFDPNNL